MLDEHVPVWKLTEVVLVKLSSTGLELFEDGSDVSDSFIRNPFSIN